MFLRVINNLGKNLVWYLVAGLMSTLKLGGENPLIDIN
jgi:hypothetical protein